MVDNTEYTRWLNVLDEMEDNLARQSSDPEWIEATQSEWQPPHGLGPLPAELEPRAHQLVSRQHDAIGQVRANREQVARHLDAIKRVPAATTFRPTYLDTSG